ncbi:cadmium resistance transporter [Nostoc sp. LEGE 12447]|uniref:cadmium resistance transporter n=1 Tax=Nostoc sp. LEGE 12447 TaxID=1828640 RepID=UPI002AD5AAA2|nr:cadmium resistance transporter [Nostoc sp. LEGE 12447]
MGLLGLVPIAVGFSSWLNQESGDSDAEDEQLQQFRTSPFASLLSPQTYNVAAITVANGSDNISIYTPLFANSSLIRLLIIIVIFFLLVGVWCYASYKLISQNNIADVLNRYSSNLVPFILVGLGVYIILESGALNSLALVASCICLMLIVKKYKSRAQVEDN